MYKYMFIYIHFFLNRENTLKQRKKTVDSGTRERSSITKGAGGPRYQESLVTVGRRNQAGLGKSWMNRICPQLQSAGEPQLLSQPQKPSQDAMKGLHRSQGKQTGHS